MNSQIVVISTDNENLAALTLAHYYLEAGCEVIIYVPRKSPKNYTKARLLMKEFDLNVHEVERGTRKTTTLAATRYAQKFNATLISLWDIDAKKEELNRV